MDMKVPTVYVFSGGAILFKFQKQSPAGVVEATYHHWTTLERSMSCFPDNHRIELFSQQAFPLLQLAKVITQCEDDDGSPGGVQEANWNWCGGFCVHCAEQGPDEPWGLQVPSLADFRTCFHLLANCRRSIAPKLPALAGKTACR